VGTNPVSLAVGDLNGDVKLDLAIVNASSNDATILLGNGSGAFTQAAGSPVEVGPSPRFVVIRDWNADGKLDLAVANRFSDFVTIMMGNGLGGFTQAAGSPIPVEAGPYSIAAGDVNADGKLDLAVANNGSNNVTIVLGNGSGGFTQVAGSPVAVGANPESVALADVSGDGKLDLAVANAGSNNVTILLGSGTGGFSQAAGSPLAAGTNPEFVSVADLNGDGTVDLAVANGGSNSITIMLGTGSGVFSEAAGSPVAVGSNPVPVGVGDWNGDGKRDLAVANFSSSNLTILLNNTTSADDGTACTDGNACTTGDVCTSGSCGGTPVPPPSAINNSVRLDKTPTNATISWNDSPNPYNVYRGSRAAGAVWSYNQTCLSPGVAGNSAQDTVAPVPGQLLYYLVSRKSSCNESSLGRDSAGADRPNGAPCGDGP
jgi:hypothetical protein